MITRFLDWWGRFQCDALGWHAPTNPVGFDGYNLTSACYRCKRRLLQDSQGNWFASGSNR